MPNVPELQPHCGSWVVVDRVTGKAVLETSSRNVVERVNQKRYEVLTTLDHLAALNEQAELFHMKL